MIINVDEHEHVEVYDDGEYVCLTTHQYETDQTIELSPDSARRLGRILIHFAEVVES